MSVTDTTGLSRRYQPQPPVPYCIHVGCDWLPDLICNADGAHKAALGHAVATGHQARVAETVIVIYAPAGDAA